MAALFGILGRNPRTDAEAMSRALAHRAQIGSIVRIEGLPSGAGWFGVISKDAEAQLGGDSQGRLIACHADLYIEGVAWEVLSEAMDEGAKALEPLDGQFAAARLDGGTLTIVTDSLGTVPLYWTRLCGGGLAFASEYKALLTLPGVSAELDLEMAGYLQYSKSLPVGKTLARGIRCFGPGVRVELTSSGEVLGEKRFGALAAAPTISDESNAIELLAGALRGAVERRARDLEPVGLCLSGGIDSILVAFLLRDLFPDRVIHTFCSGSSAGDSECVTARQVAGDIRSVHHEIITPPEMLSTHLEPLVWHLEDPYARSETLQLRECARHARDTGLDTLLVAQGADDLFAGMPKCRLLWLMKKFPFAASGLWEFYSFTQTNTPTKTVLGRAMNRLKYRGQVPAPPIVLGGGFMPVHMEMPRVGPHMINTMLAEQFQGSTHKSTKKMERVFASFGIQYRSPFHDRGLAEIAYSIDEKLKVTRTEQKRVLRQTARRWVPERYIRIPKFPQRMQYDLQFAKQIDKLFDLHLSPEKVAMYGIFEPESIARLKRTGVSSLYKDEAAMRIWTAAMTHLWADQFGNESGKSTRNLQQPAVLPSGSEGEVA